MTLDQQVIVGQHTKIARVEKKLDELPAELLVEILGYLPLADLGRLAQTCTLFMRWCRELVRKRIQQGNLLKCVSCQDTMFMRAWLQHQSSEQVMDSQVVAIRCLLNFLTPQNMEVARRHAILEAQLLCFIHHQDTSAAHVLLSHPWAIRLCFNPTRAWIEWHISTVVWHFPRLPECIMTWARSLMSPRPQDLTLVDNLFFHWNGAVSSMLELMSTMTASRMTMHDLLVLHVDMNSFAGHYLFSDTFTCNIGYSSGTIK